MAEADCRACIICDIFFKPTSDTYLCPKCDDTLTRNIEQENLFDATPNLSGSTANPSGSTQKKKIFIHKVRMEHKTK